MQSSLPEAQMIYTNRKVVFKAALRLSNKGKAFYNSKVLPKITEAANNAAQFFENLEEENLLSPDKLAAKLECSVSYIKKLKKLGIIIPEICLPKFVRYRYSSVVASLKRKGRIT